MSKFLFFRQSGWMFLATTISGVLMAATHKAAKQMGPDYGVFWTLLSVLSQMAIPAVGLQLTFVHQSVAAFDQGRQAELKGALLSLLRWSFIFWAVAALGAFIFQAHILSTYKINDAAALWMTLLTALLSLWQPALLGVLQGRQNFLWVGWSAILNGLVRLLAVSGVVLVFGGHAAGAMAGVLLGMLVSLGVAAWPIRELRHVRAMRFNWAPWLKKVAPITLSLGAVVVVLTQDSITVQAFFPKDETSYYSAAAMIGRTLYFLTAPMAAVLFPKIVQSSLRAEKSTALFQAVGATAILGGTAALGCTLLPEVPLRLIFDPSFLRIAPLVTLYTWCALPLALANVLVSNLLARERFKVVYWLVAVAAGYWVTLRLYHPSFRHVIFTFGTFSTLLFVGTAFFTWRASVDRPPENVRPLPAG